MEVGDLIQTLKQAFNIKPGIDPRANRLSDRALAIPTQDEGDNKGRSVLIEQMMEAYWKEFGWDASTGRPTGETLARLGISAHF